MAAQPYPHSLHEQCSVGLRGSFVVTLHHHFPIHTSINTFSITSSPALLFVKSAVWATNAEASILLYLQNQPCVSALLSTVYQSVYMFQKQDIRCT